MYTTSSSVYKNIFWSPQEHSSSVRKICRICIWPSSSFQNGKNILCGGMIFFVFDLFGFCNITYLWTYLHNDSSNLLSCSREKPATLIIWQTMTESFCVRWCFLWQEQLHDHLYFFAKIRNREHLRCTIFLTMKNLAKAGLLLVRSKWKKILGI